VAIRQRIVDCLAALAVTLLALIAAPASAQTFPQLTGRVVDQANLLSPSQEVDLASRSQALEAQSGRQFVVATVNSLEGRNIEDYGYRLGRHWKIGDEKRDDGVLLLVAPNEKKVRIETGYGARVFLTDAVSSQIVRDAILPRFKAGDMAGGIMAGADRIMETMRLPADQAARNAAQAEARQEQRQESREGGFPFFFIILTFFFVVLPMLKAAGGRKRRYHSKRRGGVDPWIVLWGLNEISRSSRGGGGWGGGGFGGGGFGGGGGFSGGGGSFGGGGASGGW
jgi:uncharacterized protein